MSLKTVATFVVEVDRIVLSMMRPVNKSLSDKKEISSETMQLSTKLHRKVHTVEIGPIAALQTKPPSYSGPGSMGTLGPHDFE